MNNYKFQNYYYFRNIKESVEIIEELIVNNVLPENFWKTLQDGIIQEISIQERMLAPSRGWVPPASRGAPGQAANVAKMKSTQASRGWTPPASRGAQQQSAPSRGWVPPASRNDPSQAANVASMKSTQASRGWTPPASRGSQQQQQPAAAAQQQPAAQQAQAGTSQQKKGVWGGIKGAISKPFQAIGKKVSDKTWFGSQGPGLFKPGGLFNPVGLGPVDPKTGQAKKGYGHVDVKSSGPGGQNEPYWQKFNKKHGIKSEWTGASNSLLGEAISKLYTSAKYASPEHRYELMFLIKQLQEYQK